MPRNAIRTLAYRPFFIAGSGYAGLAILASMPADLGALWRWSSLPPYLLHAHELVFGYVPAIVAGYALTAAARWTGRPPIPPLTVAALLALWVLGRCGIVVGALVRPDIAATADVLFLPAVAAVLAKEVIAGRTWRRLVVVGVLLVLAASNALFHLDSGRLGGAYTALRIGVGATIMLISVVGGGILPRYTRRWLEQRTGGRMPLPFGAVDMAALAVSTLALALWIAAPQASTSAWTLLLAGALQTARLARWAGDRTTDNLLVLGLHIAYAFIPLGFFVAAGSALTNGIAPDAAIHAWGAGAIGLMTLTVMVRTALRYAGRPRMATPIFVAIYAAVAGSAALRIGAALQGAGSGTVLAVAGLLWGFGLLALSVWLAMLPNRAALGADDAE